MTDFALANNGISMPITINNPLKWFRNILVESKSKWKKAYHEGGILIEKLDTFSNIKIPIPAAGIEILKEHLSEKDYKSYGFRILYCFCYKKVTEQSYVPFGGFMEWDSTKEIRTIIGGKKGRELFKTISELLFDYTNHSEGNFPRSYRFKPELLQEGYFLYPSYINNSGGFPRFKIINRESIKKEHIDSARFLANLDISQVHIGNKQLVSDFLEKSEKKFLSSINPRRNKGKKIIKWFYLDEKPKFKMEKIEFSAEKFNNYSQLEIELIQQRKLYHLNNINQIIDIKRDNITYRLHHNLTNLPKECVNYITHGGERLCEIDMSNCHYTLFSHILSGNKILGDFDGLLFKSNAYQKAFNHFKTTNSSIIRIVSDIIYTSEEPQPIGSSPLYKMEHFIEVMGVSEYKDLILFIVASFKGCIYEVIGELMYGEGYKPEHREKVKKILMAIFYGYFNSNKTKEVWMFIKYFPTVYQIITDLKAEMYRMFEDGRINKDALFDGCICSAERKSKTAYKAGNSCLPILLMNAETSVFIDYLLPNLQGRGFNVLSKHDAILVKETEYEDVKRVINELLIDVLGEDTFDLK